MKVGQLNQLLLATQWLWAYNNESPHSAIEDISHRYLLDTA